MVFEGNCCVPHLFVYSVQQGIVPGTWKQFHITPVYRGGSTDNSPIYRLISAVSVVAKILEMVSTQLSSYLEDHKLLHPNEGDTGMERVLKTFC